MLPKCFTHTYKHMTGSFSLPLEAVSDLTYSHISLFLQSNDQIWDDSISVLEFCVLIISNIDYLCKLENNGVIHIELCWYWLD